MQGGDPYDLEEEEEEEEGGSKCTLTTKNSQNPKKHNWFENNVTSGTIWEHAHSSNMNISEQISP